MGRRKGSLNKRTIKRNIFQKIIGYFPLTNEAEFINDLSRNYIKWKKKGESEYSEIYKMLIHKYTNINT
jgi:hypothetical protein